MSNKFDGLGGRLIAPIMARMNAAAEMEAIQTLDPRADADVLVLGFGSGVGIALLTKVVTTGSIFGIDPSAVMMAAAAKRNKAAIAAGRVRLAQTTADAVPSENASFNAVVAVNTIQLCEPIAPTVTELARVMRPGARLVTITHDWAAAHHGGTTEKWIDQMLAAFLAGPFGGVEAHRGKSEKGKAVILTAQRNAA